MSASRRRISARTFLVLFSLALILPVAGFTAAGLYYYAKTERARIEATALQTARQIGTILDAEVSTIVAAVTALSTSTSLLRGDFQAFYNEAKAYVGERDEIVVLRTIDGRQFVNTQAAFGAELPPAPPTSDTERSVMESGKPFVSNVYRSPISGEARVAVVRKPLSAGRPDLMLAITVPTDRFLAAIEMAVPRGWTIGVGDRAGTYVTHSARHREVTGKPGVPAYLEQASGKEGTFYGKSGIGVALLAGYYRTALTGWLVAANIAVETIEQPLRRSLALTGGVALSLMLVSVLLAFVFSRWLAGAASALAHRAEAVGSGTVTEPLASGITEFGIVDRALGQAAIAVAERSRLTRELGEALKHKDILIKEVNHRVKNSLQLVASLLNLQRTRIADRDTRAHFEEAARRVNTVAQIHQRLYADDRPDRVAFHELLKELCADLNRVLPERNVTIECRTVPVYLPTGVVVPLALIVNELVSNAFKHAFKDRPSGVVQVSCALESDMLVLTVADNGVKLQAPLVPGDGLGLKIVNALLAQLRGKLETANSPEGKALTLFVPMPQIAAGESA